MNTDEISAGRASWEPAACARCGKAIDPDDSFLVIAGAGGGQAAICRVEHIVAWVMRGAGWQSERPWEDGVPKAADGPVTLIRRRAGAELDEQFESPEGLRAWASAGGHWAR